MPASAHCVPRANHLIVIAGPPCVGKTTLVARIRGGGLSSLCGQIGIRDPTLWMYRDATELARMPEAVDRLVVHYDFMAQRLPHGYRYLPEMIARAETVVFLTLSTSPDILRRRSRARLAGGFTSLFHNPLRAPERFARLRRIWKRHRALRQSPRVVRLYEDWFDFTSTYPTAPHWVVDATETWAVAAERFEIARSRMSIPGTGA